MRTRYFALVFGVVFLVVGLCGFVPGFLATGPGGAAGTTGDPAAGAHAGHALLFGLFPVNLLHNLVHLAFGVGGVIAYRSYAGARGYARAVAIVYAVLTVMGLIPGLNTTFGLVPIYGNDVWLHALLAIVAAYFGFAAPGEGEGRVAGGPTPARGA